MKFAKVSASPGATGPYRVQAADESGNLYYVQGGTTLAPVSLATKVAAFSGGNYVLGTNQLLYQEDGHVLNTPGGVLFSSMSSTENTATGDWRMLAVGTNKKVYALYGSMNVTAAAFTGDAVSTATGTSFSASTETSTTTTERSSRRRPASRSARSRGRMTITATGAFSRWTALSRRSTHRRAPPSVW